jgi:hypothetical protein
MVRRQGLSPWQERGIDVSVSLCHCMKPLLQWLLPHRKAMERAETSREPKPTSFGQFDKYSATSIFKLCTSDS